jgi:hypothetical protein
MLDLLQRLLARLHCVPHGSGITARGAPHITSSQNDRNRTVEVKKFRRFALSASRQLA